MVRRAFDPGEIWCFRALAWCLATHACIGASTAATVAERARESGCVGKPVAITDVVYKCTTTSGAEAFFNATGVGGAAPAPRKADKAVASTSPTGFPRVDAETQKGRDDLRRKVLGDELAAEEKSLSEARVAFDNGAPAPLPEEKADAEKYRQRISRLRQAVQLHERNVEALKKELTTTR